jgi:hypothetical protein
MSRKIAESVIDFGRSEPKVMAGVSIALHGDSLAITGLIIYCSLAVERQEPCGQVGLRALLDS